MKRRTVFYLVMAVGGVVAGFDVYLLFDDEPSNTISSAVRDVPWIPGALGFVAAHLAQKTPRGQSVPGSISIVAGVLAIGGSMMLGGGILGLVFGGVMGWFFWKNTGAS